MYAILAKYKEEEECLQNPKHLTLPLNVSARFPLLGGGAAPDSADNMRTTAALSSNASNWKGGRAAWAS